MSDNGRMPMIRTFLGTSRLALQLLIILKNDTFNVSKITELVEKPISSVSETLSALQAYEILHVERKGRQRLYSFKNDEIKNQIFNDQEIRPLMDRANITLKQTRTYVEESFGELLYEELSKKYEVTRDISYDGIVRGKKLGYMLASSQNRVGIRILCEENTVSTKIYNTIGQLYEWDIITPTLDKLISVHISFIGSTPSQPYISAQPISVWKLRIIMDKMFENSDKIFTIMESINVKELNQSEFIEYLSNKIDDIINN